MSKASLSLYQKKRKFSETPEPAGKVRLTGQERFSIQEHHARRLHYDLRLEMDGVLKSWAMPKGLPASEGERRLAVMTEDHPVDYLDFEGIIPEGNYGAGRVVLWEIGTYQIVKGNLEEGKLTFTIFGRRHHGKFTLVKPSLQGDQNSWFIIKGGPAPFPEGSDPLPSPFSPMRATLADAPFSDPEWLCEPKWDGVRAVARLQRRRNEIKIDLWGRNLSRFDTQYPEVIAALSRLMEANPSVSRLLLDGEIVAYNHKGTVSFQELQRRMHLTTPAEIEAVRRSTPVDYLLFDLLFINGKSVMESPLTYRRTLLSELKLPAEGIRLSPVHDDGAALFKTLTETGGEGIVMKRKESPYLPGKRGRDWMKVKIIQEKECVVAGWTEGKGNRSHRFGALLLGLYDGKELVYIGHTGSGFNAAGLEEAMRLLAPLETGRCPYQKKPVTNAKAHWIRPELVAQIKFSNWTKDRHLRAPVFLGFRDDVAAAECRFEPEVTASKVIGKKSKKEAVWIGDRVTVRFEGHPIEVSHLDKVLWPDKGYTKAHMIDYYIQAAPFLLPHLADRPLTLIRFPDGIEGESFYQKDWKETPPLWVKRILVQPGSDEKEKRRMVLCENALTLIWLANLGNIELHPWYSRVDHQAKKIDRPDFIVFDIDPPKIDGSPAVAWERFEQSVEVAFWLKKMLSEEGIGCWLKTSGKSGLHIFVPIVRKYSYAQTRRFARAVAERLESEHPNQITTAWKKEKRGKKVLVDFNQNAQGKTLASIYSLRATPEATVSAPVTWEELPKISPVQFTLETMPARLKKEGDLWKEILKSAQTLGAIGKRGKTR
ncbi:MAG TPA: DNA ligase D [Candidatus Manganitrophaceae bacterium]|nr:DNA ligase D [Candidatus Manganitrophaceae bacterium]